MAISAGDVTPGLNTLENKNGVLHVTLTHGQSTESFSQKLLRSQCLQVQNLNSIRRRTCPCVTHTLDMHCLMVMMAPLTVVRSMSGQNLESRNSQPHPVQNFQDSSLCWDAGNLEIDHFLPLLLANFQGRRLPLLAKEKAISSLIYFVICKYRVCFSKSQTVTKMIQQSLSLTYIIILPWRLINFKDLREHSQKNIHCSVIHTVKKVLGYTLDDCPPMKKQQVSDIHGPAVPWNLLKILRLTQKNGPHVTSSTYHSCTQYVTKLLTAYPSKVLDMPPGKLTMSSSLSSLISAPCPFLVHRRL